MRKIFFSIVALLATITMTAQVTPTVSTSSITLRYCTTKTHTETVSIPETNFPYIWDGQNYASAGTYERLYTAADGCDSIATLVLKAIVSPKYLAVAKDQILYAQSVLSMPSSWQSKFQSTSVGTGANKEYKAKEDIYIVISRGNLQYHTSDRKFRFAEHGYIWCGDDNKKIGSYTNTWIDMFSWSTSGYNQHEPYYNYTYSSTNCGNGANWEENYDWGQYNNIENGTTTDPKGTWFVPTGGMLQSTLYNAAKKNKLGCGSVNGVKGWIVLPEVFEQPEGTPAWVAQAISTDNGSRSTYAAWADNNVYTEDQWALMEDAGAIFFIADDIYPRVGKNFSSQWTIAGGDNTTIPNAVPGAGYWIREINYSGFNMTYMSTGFPCVFSTSLAPQFNRAPYMLESNNSNVNKLEKHMGQFVRLIKLYE